MFTVFYYTNRNSTAKSLSVRKFNTNDTTKNQSQTSKSKTSQKTSAKPKQQLNTIQATSSNTKVNDRKTHNIREKVSQH